MMFISCNMILSIYEVIRYYVFFGRIKSSQRINAMPAYMTIVPIMVSWQWCLAAFWLPSVCLPSSLPFWDQQQLTSSSTVAPMAQWCGTRTLPGTLKNGYAEVWDVLGCLSMDHVPERRAIYWLFLTLRRVFNAIKSSIYLFTFALLM